MELGKLVCKAVVHRTGLKGDSTDAQAHLNPNEITFWPHLPPPQKISLKVFHLNLGHICEDHSNGFFKLIT